eukprot:gnl/Hemi2/5115_TR1789_c0_g1_i2.p1 gnl/Hemi2/5115_TR1789_c0_g1~~gnl/Hemi2/5115_TR1789_c0_g1_i2.p1  ORF type:complete len:926 (+),score=251.24 gnl/Hemi2/5115_TR1789_c0_g1_i2:134-2911(+)
MFGFFSDLTNTYKADEPTRTAVNRKKRSSILQPRVLAENRENFCEEPTITNFGSAKKKRVSFAYAKASDTRYYLKDTANKGCADNQHDIENIPPEGDFTRHNCQSMEVTRGFGTVKDFGGSDELNTSNMTFTKNVGKISQLGLFSPTKNILDNDDDMDVTSAAGMIQVHTPATATAPVTPLNDDDDMEITGGVMPQDATATTRGDGDMEVTRALGSIQAGLSSPYTVTKRLGDSEMEMTRALGSIQAVGSSPFTVTKRAGDGEMEMTRALGSIQALASSPFTLTRRTGGGEMEMTQALGSIQVAAAPYTIHCDAHEDSMEITGEAQNMEVTQAGGMVQVAEATNVDYVDMDITQQQPQHVEALTSHFTAPFSCSAIMPQEGEMTMTTAHGRICPATPTVDDLLCGDMRQQKQQTPEEDRRLTDFSRSIIDPDTRAFDDVFLSATTIQPDEVFLVRSASGIKRIIQCLAEAPTPPGPSTPPGRVSDSSYYGGDDVTGTSYRGDDDTMDYTGRMKRMRISDFNFGSIRSVMQEYAQNPPTPPPPAPLTVQEFMELAGINKFMDEITANLTGRVEGSSTATPTTPAEVLRAKHIDGPLDSLLSQAFNQLDAAAAATSQEISTCEATIAETNPAIFRELQRAASGPGLVDVQNEVKRLKFSCYTAAQTAYYEWAEQLELQKFKVLTEQFEKLRNERDELWELVNKARPPVSSLPSEAEKASLKRLDELADIHDILPALTGLELLQVKTEHVIMSLGAPAEKALKVSVHMADKSITSVDCLCLVDPLASPLKYRLLADADCASLLSSARLPNQLPGVVREAGFRINRVESLVAEVKALSERFPVTHNSSSTSSITVDFCNPATAVYNSVTFSLSWVYPFADKLATVECKGSGMLPSTATQHLTQKLQSVEHTFGWLTTVCHELQRLWCAV